MKQKNKKIEKMVNEQAIVISFYGQLGFEESNEIGELVDTEKLERDTVIFDFTGAEYISSSLLGQLVGIRTKMVNANLREPIITGCNKTIFDLFEMTGVIYLFKFVMEHESN